MGVRVIDGRAVELLTSIVYLVRMYSNRETGKVAFSERERTDKRYDLRKRYWLGIRIQSCARPTEEPF